MDNNQELLTNIQRVADIAESTGVLKGRLEVLSWLLEKGALRDSMLPGMHVLYTESGPIDVSLNNDGTVNA
jgi:hypothetical protein